MTKKIIVANWKMNPRTAKEADGLLSEILACKTVLKNAEIIICPPCVYLDRLSAMLRTPRRKLQIKLGSQDVFWEKGGSYTGEISIPMLKSLEVRYVVVGHSERREYLGETDEMINKKIRAGLKAGLKVIFCLGEKERDDRGGYLKDIQKKLNEGLSKVSKKELSNLIICYEPIWAISSSKSARADTPDDFLQTSIYIRRSLFFKFGHKMAHQIPIIYGGSVTAANVKDFLIDGKAGGVLVGRASWKVKTFADLLKSL